MDRVRSALYLDFDNVFSGLHSLDPEAALQFATDPASWLVRLAAAVPTGTAQRRWLILRCYLNPAGSVQKYRNSSDKSRLYFSDCRVPFVRAGFEVIDCPRYSATKNGADIRLVIDAVDALAAGTRYEEFVVASGDSDMTPLLQRLRRDDRRTTIISPAVAAEAYTAIADQVLDSQQLLALIQGSSDDLEDDLGSVLLDHHRLPGTMHVDRDEAHRLFSTRVTTAYQDAIGPLNKATLALRIRSELHRVVDDTNWFGSGSFTRAVEALELPNLQMSEHMLWDGSRHKPPELTASEVQKRVLPEPVERLAQQINLPRLPRTDWHPIYQTLSDYAHTHRFNLTECTGWSRDQLREKGISVSRNAVGFVVRGTSFGGCPLHRQPPPDASEIAAAFVENVLRMAEAAELIFADEDIDRVRSWLATPT